MIYKILDYITQSFCSHNRKWLSSQEYNSNDSNIHTLETHCFRCWKKWFKKCNYTWTVQQECKQK